MAFDAFTMAAVADEVRATCVGGRIQAVMLPAPRQLAWKSTRTTAFTTFSPQLIHNTPAST